MVGGAGVQLLLWAPRPARGLSSDSGSGAGASQSIAASTLAAYNDHFSVLIKMNPNATGTSHSLHMASWTAFMSRWLAAAAAATKVRINVVANRLLQKIAR